MSFGENLRKARQELGLTQEELGNRLGVAAQTVSKWERGESLPDAVLLPALADALGLSIDRLFDRKKADFADAAAAAENWLLSLEKGGRWQKSMQLLWVIRSALSGIPENPDFPDEFKESFSRLKDGDTTSGIAKAEGVSVFFKQENLSFVTLFPTPAAGWGPALEQDNPALWEALANAEVRKTLRAFYGLGKFAYLDRSYLYRLLGELEIQNPDSVLQALKKLRVLQGGNTWLDGRETELYTLYPHADLLQLLLLGNAGPWGTVSFGPADEQPD